MGGGKPGNLGGGGNALTTGGEGTGLHVVCRYNYKYSLVQLSISELDHAHRLNNGGADPITQCL